MFNDGNAGPRSPWIDEGFIYKGANRDDSFMIRPEMFFGMRDEWMHSHVGNHYAAIGTKTTRKVYLSIHHAILNGMRADERKQREYSRYLG